MSESSSPQESPNAEGQGTPAAPTEEPPCAELKAASEKCVKDKGEEACKDLLEAYHSCLRALGTAHPDLEGNPSRPSH
ncbi:cytochrome c oxidase copper chaperone-like [Sceloporus undulatus]|uniref:cytochrome c oxidase copper chaperone-like n=1 Tax=Sceloporus undulatus TaxID=8520 RepID=UPI001C4D8A3D|nr:cytochrome c oxidase copper chaperone-like [Sceloporus undulatus]